MENTAHGRPRGRTGSIACLGWGSLIWDPRTLAMQGGWLTDGPRIHVEFGRLSRDGRITLVLCERAAAVPALWTVMAPPDLTGAIESLRDREGIPPEDAARYVGIWSRGRPAPATIPALAEWAAAHGLAHVVWTNLPPRFNGKERQPGCDEVLAYLASLRGAERAAAERYVRHAPPQIRTACRSLIEQALGWTAQAPRADGT